MFHKSVPIVLKDELLSSHNTLSAKDGKCFNAKDFYGAHY